MKTSPSEEVQWLRRLFAVGHAIGLAVLFLPVVPLALSVVSGADVIFWAGRSMLLVILVLALALALPALGGCFRPTSRFFLASVWAPAALLALVSCGYRFRAQATADALLGPACFDHPQRQDLQRAYEAADALYGACLSILVQQPGLPPEIHSVAECPRYPKTAKQWGRQFDYLASLESRFPCAGICYGGRRLWQDAGVLAPSCAPFARQALTGARAWATVLLAYSLLVIVALIPAQVALLSPLVTRYDDAIRSLSVLGPSSPP